MKINKKRGAIAFLLLGWLWILSIPNGHTEEVTSNSLSSFPPTLEKLSQISMIPKSVTNALARLELTGSSSPCTADKRLLGTWKNIEGYATENYLRTYAPDCRARSHFGEESWNATVTEDGVNWVIDADEEYN